MSSQNKDKDGFTQFNAGMFSNTLAQKLVPVADRIRDIFTQFGTRPYLVRIIRTKWSGGKRGFGRESVLSDTAITPTPKVTDLAGITEILTPIGLEEQGSILVTEISGRFTEAILQGNDPVGNEPDVDENIFYEIEFPRPDGSVRRRFGIRAAPTFKPTQLQWMITLEKQDENRDGIGDPR